MLNFQKGWFHQCWLSEQSCTICTKSKALKKYRTKWKKRDWHWNIFTLYSWEGFRSHSLLLAPLLGLKVANIKIDQSLKSLPVCALSLSFQVFFCSKASQVPAQLARCHYVFHSFTLSLIGSLINRGGGCFIRLAILSVGLCLNFMRVWIMW